MPLGDEDDGDTDALLPPEYDKLVPVKQLVHGSHNPRRVSPTEELRCSIKQSGLNRALIVRPDTADDVYHITDGWQRYQAATDCGWEELPVKIYDTPLDALAATESASIVREWSTYEWAKYCQSVADELEADSMHALAKKVADRTVKADRTVLRYLSVLSLPDEIHPLLVDGPAGTTQQWTALKHYNSDVRRYNGLSWMAAARLAGQQGTISQNRVLGIAAKAVAFEHSDDAIEFIDRAITESDQTLEAVRKKVLFGQQHPRYLEVPSVAIQLDREEKRALMEHCCQAQRSLTDIVTEAIQSLAADVTGES